MTWKEVLQIAAFILICSLGGCVGAPFTLVTVEHFMDKYEAWLEAE